MVRSLLGLLAASGVARAESPVPVLVMPTQLGGAVADRAVWLREFDARMDSAVRRTGRTPRSPGPLTAAEASCRSAECMARLAEAAGTEYVIGARVVADKGSPPSYKLVVDRYDHELPGAVRTVDAECSVCTAKEAATRLEEVAMTMLPSLVVRPVRVEPVAPVPVPLQPTSAVVPAVEPPHRKRNLEIALGVTSAVALGSIALIVVGAHGLSIDGDPVGRDAAGSQRPFLYDTKGSGTALVTTGGVLLGASVIAVALEAHALVRRPR